MAKKFQCLTCLCLMTIFVIFSRQSIAQDISEQEAQEASSDEDKKSNKERWEEDSRWSFGDYRFRLGAARPFFSKDDRDIYKKLYGTPKAHVQLAIDHMLWRDYVGIGWGMKFGYYVAQGHAATISVEDPNEANSTDITVDDAEPTELIMIPIQPYISLQFTPFPAKWITLDAWAGYERSYVQEVRSDSASSSSDEDSQTKGLKTNKYWLNSGTVGLALNFKLNYFDEASTNSMRSAMKMQAIYLSPFVELVTPLVKVSGFNFKRTSVGVLFTFETI